MKGGGATSSHSQSLLYSNGTFYVSRDIIYLTGKTPQLNGPTAKTLDGRTEAYKACGKEGVDTSAAPPQWIIGVAGSRYFLVSRNVKEPSAAASSTVGLVVGSGKGFKLLFSQQNSSSNFRRYDGSVIRLRNGNKI